jgi:CopG family transcriptional regulator/antitoxin EndoAI
MRQTKTWTISLPPQMEREAERLAKQEHRTKSELVREALRTYVISRKLRRIQEVAARRARELGIRTEDDVERIIDDIRS